MQRRMVQMSIFDYLNEQVIKAKLKLKDKTFEERRANKGIVVEFDDYKNYNNDKNYQTLLSLSNHLSKTQK